MGEPTDTSEADVKSDAGSAKREEKGIRGKNEVGDPMRKHQEDSNSRPASQNSGRSLREEELGEPNYGSDSSSGSHRQWGNSGNPVQYTDQERAELLRRLDSIKEHLLRGSSANGLPKESDQPSLPFIGPGKHFPAPPYFHPYPESFPYAGGNPMPMHGMHPSTSNPNHMSHIPGYKDPFSYQMHRRPANRYPGHYPNPMTHPYLPGQYVDIGPDIFDPHPQDPMFHPYFPPTPSRFGDVPYSPISHHQEKVMPFSPPNYNDLRSNAPPISSSGSLRPKWWLNELDSEMGGTYARGYVQKAVSATDARRCRPLAGGAPFIACHNCFELLYLPKKARFAQEKQQKLQCGACSQVISFKIVDKKLVLSSGDVGTNSFSREVEGSCKSTVVKDTVLRSHGHANQPIGNFSSIDYDNSSYDFHCMNGEPVKEPRKPQDAQTVHSSSPTKCLEDEGKSKRSSKHREVVNSVWSRPNDAKAHQPSPTHGSSLRELFEYSTANRAALIYGVAELSSHPEKESYNTQDSLKAESVATETDVSFNGYSNTEVSEDPRNAIGREEDHRLGSPKGGSGLVEVFKRSLRVEKVKASEVWVNGHLIPEDLVTSAEKSAGPIQPGNYWYDYRAGFWGVMGKPCCGIILPFIEEFSYPMPDNCAAGNTDVFVNGRELHQRDLDLLAGRGLPRDRNRSYIIDISGRVLDGESGKELDCLGKLAPTVEKIQHGFGMRVPRTLAS